MQFDLWVGVFAVLGLLLLVRAVVGRLKRKRKVLRISPEAIEASRKILVKYLPLVEDRKKNLKDIEDLPCNKNKLKSALKVMAYCFTRQKQYQELTRVKEAYVSLHRFQDGDLKDKYTINVAAREKKQLLDEIEDYLSKHFA